MFLDPVEDHIDAGLELDICELFDKEGNSLQKRQCCPSGMMAFHKAYARRGVMCFECDEGGEPVFVVPLEHRREELLWCSFHGRGWDNIGDSLDQLRLLLKRQHLCKIEAGVLWQRPRCARVQCLGG